MKRQNKGFDIDNKALTLLTMAIPNALFGRVDSRDTTKALWDELKKQFQGTEKSIQARANQLIGAYEGFKALEGETIADSYSRFNIILNDRRRNGVQKTNSEINYKFLKNLNPKWDHYSVNLQMNKNIAVLTDKQKGILSSSTTKKKSHSKAFITKKPDTESDSTFDGSSESDEDLNRFADKLALMSSQFNKKYGKQKFFSKPKSEYYKNEKYKSRGYKKKPIKNVVEKIKFAKDSKVKKVKDFEYCTSKAYLALFKEKGQVLMAEEEIWFDDTSDEESAHFTQVYYNLMARVDETINFHKETEPHGEVNQKNSTSDNDSDEMSVCNDRMHEEFSQM